MKASFFKTALLALCAMSMLTACFKPNEPSVSVSISATSPSFVDGKVDLIVALSGKATSAVSASIAVSGDIPEAALSFDKKVSIAAGSTNATVPVTVDASALEGGNYEATFTISSVTGGEVSSSNNSCKVSLSVEAVVITPDVLIQSSSESFVDGKASLKLALSQAAAEDVVVTFAFVSEYEGYNVLGADALTLENPVTIPAGTTTKDVEIVLDETKVVAGDNVAGISIDKVEGPAKKGSTKQSAWIFIVGEIKAELVSTWKLSYAGREEATNGKVYDWILVEGWTGAYYDVAVYEAGALQEEFNGDILALMEDNHNSYVGKYLGQYTIDQLLRNQATYCNFSVLDPGEYEVYLIDYTSAGAMTGKYTAATFEIEEEEATEAFSANLGIYTISATGNHYDPLKDERVDGDVEIEAVYIYPNINNSSYLVYFYHGADPETQQGVYYASILDYDAATGGLSFETKKIDTWTHSTLGAVEDWQYGYFYYTAAAGYYYITGDYTIGVADAPVDGVFTVNAGPAINLSNGLTVNLDGLRLIGSLIEYVDEKGQGGYAFTYGDYPFPATFTKVSDLPEEETDAVKAVARRATRHSSLNRPTRAMMSLKATPFNAVKK